ncbi:MAG: ATP-binding protein [Bacteroidota bacterium]
MNRNPFHPATGTIVSREYFVGRAQMLKMLEAFAHNDEHACMSIVGNPRVGKTSLVYQGARVHKKKLHERKIFLIYLTLSQYEKAEHFFLTMAQEAIAELKSANCFPKSLKRIKKKHFKKKMTTWQEINRFLEAFCKQANTEGIKLKFIIDEFDEARNLFKNQNNYFSGLRSLFDNPDSRISLLLISRRDIKLIEDTATDGNSTLHGIFGSQTFYIGPFSKEEIDEYFLLFDKGGFPQSEQQKNNIVYYCGGHPYLLNAICHTYYQKWQSELTPTIDDVFDCVNPTFSYYYEALEAILREDKRFDNTLRILFGPLSRTVSVDDANQLEWYGIIHREGEERYTSFSEHFDYHLYSLGHKDNFWPVWQDAEKLLRKLIGQLFQKTHGDDWQEEFSYRHPTIYHALHDRRIKEDPPSDLMDYLSPQELFAVILHHENWELFHPILNSKASYSLEEWQDRINLILKVREPISNNRTGHLTPPQINQAESFCSHIHMVVRKYFATE